MGRKFSPGVTQDGLVSVTINANTVTTVVSNDDLLLSPNGTGIVKATSHLQMNAQNSIRFANSGSTFYTALRGGSNAANYTLTLPAAVTGTAGYALTSDTSGNLSWSAVGPQHDVENASSSTYYPVITTTTASGYLTTTRVSSTKLTYQPSTGTLTSTIFTESSSIALKENFDPIENALEKIMELTGWIYDRKDGSHTREAGLIAEDVYPVIPNVVTLDENGKPAGINYSRFSAYLIEAVKSLKQEINELKGIK